MDLLFLRLWRISRLIQVLLSWSTKRIPLIISIDRIIWGLLHYPMWLIGLSSGSTSIDLYDGCLLSVSPAIRMLWVFTKWLILIVLILIIFLFIDFFNDLFNLLLKLLLILFFLGPKIFLMWSPCLKVTLLILWVILKLVWSRLWRRESIIVIIFWVWIFTQ